jgi:hypothetical protein
MVRGNAMKDPYPMPALCDWCGNPGLLSWMENVGRWLCPRCQPKVIEMFDKEHQRKMKLRKDYKEPGVR